MAADTAARVINPEQVGSFIRTVLQAVSSITGWAFLQSGEMTGTIVSVLTFVVITAWGLWARRDKALVQSADNVPAVDEMQVNNADMAASHSTSAKVKLSK